MSLVQLNPTAVQCVANVLYWSVGKYIREVPVSTIASVVLLAAKLELP